MGNFIPFHSKNTRALDSRGYPLGTLGSPSVASLVPEQTRHHGNQSGLAWHQESAGVDLEDPLHVGLLWPQPPLTYV